MKTSIDKLNEENVQILEKYLKRLEKSNSEFRDYNIQECKKAILYYKGDKTQKFNPTLIEDLIFD